MPSFSQLHDVFEGTSTELNVIRRCENCMAIKAVRKVTGGESEWSDVKCFGMIFVSWSIFLGGLLQEELIIVFFFFLFFILIMSLMSLHACAGSEPNALVYAAIIIPMMFAVLAALTLMCCKKYVKSLCFLSAAGCVTCSL